MPASSWQWEQVLQPRSPVWWIVGGGVGAILAALAWSRLRRAPDPMEAERRRRSRISEIGRITAGEIVDVLDDIPAHGLNRRMPEAPRLQRVVVYRYEVRGVQYEASQDIAPLLSQMRFKACLPGLPADVKFDPANPGNSIVVGETWTGLR